MSGEQNVNVRTRKLKPKVERQRAEKRSTLLDTDATLEVEAKIREDKRRTPAPRADTQSTSIRFGRIPRRGKPRVTDCLPMAREQELLIPRLAEGWVQVHCH